MIYPNRVPFYTYIQKFRYKNYKNEHIGLPLQKYANLGLQRFKYLIERSVTEKHC